MQQDDGTAGLEQELMGFEAMGPEGFRQHVGLGTLDQRGALARQGTADQMGMLGQQMEQAQAFARPVGKDYGTVGGNIGGGIGDALKQFVGQRQMASIGGKQADLLQQGQAAQTGILDQQDAGRLSSGNARFEAMKQFLAKRQQPQQAPGMSPAPQRSFGLSGLTLDPTLFGG